MTEEQKRLDGLLRRIAALQLQFDQVRLTGGRDVIVEGEPRRGFKIDIRDDGVGEEQPPQSGGGLRGCTNPMATNYNPYATVDDGSCVFPAGDCPTDITLACDSVSASKFKCGFGGFLGTGFFRDYLFTGSGTSSQESSLTPPQDNSCSGDASWSTHETIDSDCIETDVCSTSESRTYGPDSGQPDCSGSDSQCIPAGVHPLATSAFWTLPPTIGASGGCVGPCTVFSGGPVSVTNTEVDYAWTVISGSFTPPGHGSGSGTAVLSDEYTTAELKSNTIADLPPYDGSFGSSSCTASANLASDESSYAITRFEYKFTFSPIANNFILSWNEHTEFDGGGSSDNHRSTTVSTGEVETGVFVCTEPSANGTTTITDIVCTPA